eukprot:6198156-Pleurochrysis_carterae.AAC.2
MPSNPTRTPAFLTPPSSPRLPHPPASLFACAAHPARTRRGGLDVGACSHGTARPFSTRT